MIDIAMITKYLPVHTAIIFVMLSLILYYSCNKAGWRRISLIISGSAFISLYAGPVYLLFTIIFSTIIFIVSKILIKHKSRLLLALVIISSISILSVIKSGLPGVIAREMLVTLGVSYYTFKFIHYIVDIYRGRISEVSYPLFLSYILFYPPFSAGPIDRYGNFSIQPGLSVKYDESLSGMIVSLKNLPEKAYVNEGIKRIIYGLFKKYIIADKTSLIIGQIAPDFSEAALYMKVVTVLLYSFRIYYDFAGYSDIAIGLGRLFGIKIPENFNRPYLKRNITLFWQNWHITLTSWLREYLFMPVAGKLMPLLGIKHPLLLNFICQMITMAAVGLWHGFSLNFLAWGLYHGVGLSLHRIFTFLFNKYVPKKTRDAIALSKAAGLAGTAVTFIFVSTGWIFFYG